jgi:hypothetical protein
MSGERPTIAKLERQKRILGFLNGLTLSKELGIGSVVDSRNISGTGAISNGRRDAADKYNQGDDGCRAAIAPPRTRETARSRLVSGQTK